MRRCPYCETSIMNCECVRCKECQERITETNPISECPQENHDNEVWCQDCCDPSEHCSSCGKWNDYCECTFCEWCDSAIPGEYDACGHDHSDGVGYNPLCVSCCDDICPDCDNWKRSCTCDEDDEDDEDDGTDEDNPRRCLRCGYEDFRHCSCGPKPEWLADAERTFAPIGTDRCRNKDSSDGWVCTREKGHTGYHVGHISATLAVGVWDQDGLNVYNRNRRERWCRYPRDILKVR